MLTAAHPHTVLVGEISGITMKSCVFDAISQELLLHTTYSRQSNCTVNTSVGQPLSLHGNDDVQLFFLQLTWADLAFLMFISWGKLSGNETLLDKYPKLKALEKRVESVPKVAAWIAKRPVTEF